MQAQGFLINDRPSWLDESADITGLTVRLADLADDVAAQFADRSLQKKRSRYMERLWQCVNEHGSRLAVSQRITWDSLVLRLRAGDLGYERIQSDVLSDVAFAQALEFGERKAAEHFDREWMPLVRAQAMRLSGATGRDAVENFAAELLLPRGDCDPRIASFRGRTSFKSWLRIVVTNYCTEVGRKSAREAKVSSDEWFENEPNVSTDGVVGIEHLGCVELLTPAVRSALRDVPSEDRLLVKLVLLDSIPQQQLALTLRIHPGNVTRRRQRAIDAIWSAVTSAVHSGSARFRDCLHVILAGDDVESQRSLGAVLMTALAQAASPEAVP